MSIEELRKIGLKYGYNSSLYKEAYNSITNKNGLIVRFIDNDTVEAAPLDEVTIKPSDYLKGEIIGAKVSNNNNKIGMNLLPYIASLGATPTSATNIASKVVSTATKWLPKLSFVSTYGSTPAALTGDMLITAVPTAAAINDIKKNGFNPMNTFDAITGLIPAVSAVSQFKKIPRSTNVVSKNTLKPWKNGEGINYTTRFSIKGKPDLYFELVKDTEPGYYSVHFKINLGSLNNNEKDELFRAVYQSLPNGAKLSTYGEVSKGGFSGLNRFKEQYGMIPLNETRTVELKDKSSLNEIINKYSATKNNDNKSVNIPILLKNKNVDIQNEIGITSEYIDDFGGSIQTFNNNTKKDDYSGGSFSLSSLKGDKSNNVYINYLGDNKYSIDTRFIDENTFTIDDATRISDTLNDILPDGAILLLDDELSGNTNLKQALFILNRLTKKDKSFAKTLDSNKFNAVSGAVDYDSILNNTAVKPSHESTSYDFTKKFTTELEYPILQKVSNEHDKKLFKDVIKLNLQEKISDPFKRNLAIDEDPKIDYWDRKYYDFGSLNLNDIYNNPDWFKDVVNYYNNDVAYREFKYGYADSINPNRAKDSFGNLVSVRQYKHSPSNGFTDSENEIILSRNASSDARITLSHEMTHVDLNKFNKDYNQYGFDLSKHRIKRMLRPLDILIIKNLYDPGKLVDYNIIREGLATNRLQRFTISLKNNNKYAKQLDKIIDKMDDNDVIDLFSKSNAYSESGFLHNINLKKYTKNQFADLIRTAWKTIPAILPVTIINKLNNKE